MMASHVSSLALFFLICNLVLVSSELVLEEGYEVTTVINGHKLNINPYSVIPRPGTSDLVVLDSARGVFYTVSFPLSEGSVIKRISGEGKDGYEDGELGSARFNKPRSFAVDLKGNVYVADKSNSVIRKLTHSGVSTIAGGYSRKQGHDDGPAQNASFSGDFELTFVPGICALLISDHGNQLVRQINLKAEDCARSSQSALGAVPLWVLGLGLSYLLGMVIGFVVRPYITRLEGSKLLHFNVTWRHYLANLVKQVQMLCFGIRSVIASSTLYVLSRRLFRLSLSHLSLMFGINYLESQNSHKDASLLYSNDCSVCKKKESSRSADHQLKDLISFDENLDLKYENISGQENDNQERTDVFSNSYGKLDANIIGFSEAKETTPQLKDLISFDENLDLLYENISKQENDDQERTNVFSDSLGKLDDMIKANIKETTPKVGCVVGSSGLVRRCK